MQAFDTCDRQFAHQGRVRDIESSYIQVHGFRIAAECEHWIKSVDTTKTSPSHYRVKNLVVWTQIMRVNLNRPLAHDVKTAILGDNFKVSPFNRANNRWNSIVCKYNIKSKNFCVHKL